MEGGHEGLHPVFLPRADTSHTWEGAELLWGLRRLGICNFRSKDCVPLSTCAKVTDLAQDRTRPRRECSECGRASVMWVAFPHWETLRHRLSVAAGAKKYQDVRLFVYLGRQGVCVCVCIVHVPTHMYMCICVHMSAYVCVCTCVSVCVHVCGCGTGEGGLG